MDRFEEQLNIQSQLKQQLSNKEKELADIQNKLNETAVSKLDASTSTSDLNAIDYESKYESAVKEIAELRAALLTANEKYDMNIVFLH
jgi:hypothetical protein